MTYGRACDAAHYARPTSGAAGDPSLTPMSAALYRHFIRHDAVLQRMLPRAIGRILMQDSCRPYSEPRQGC
jgi:hypothetical protein